MIKMSDGDDGRVYRGRGVWRVCWLVLCGLFALGMTVSGAGAVRTSYAQAESRSSMERPVPGLAADNDSEFGVLYEDESLLIWAQRAGDDDSVVKAEAQRSLVPPCFVPGEVEQMEAEDVGTSSLWLVVRDKVTGLECGLDGGEIPYGGRGKEEERGPLESSRLDHAGVLPVSTALMAELVPAVGIGGAVVSKGISVLVRRAAWVLAAAGVGAYVYHRQSVLKETDQMLSEGHVLLSQISEVNGGGHDHNVENVEEAEVDDHFYASSSSSSTPSPIPPVGDLVLGAKEPTEPRSQASHRRRPSRILSDEDDAERRKRVSPPPPSFFFRSLQEMSQRLFAYRIESLFRIYELKPKQQKKLLGLPKSSVLHFIQRYEDHTYYGYLVDVFFSLVLKTVDGGRGLLSVSEQYEVSAEDVMLAREDLKSRLRKYLTRRVLSERFPLPQRRWSKGPSQSLSAGFQDGETSAKKRKQHLETAFKSLSPQDTVARLNEYLVRQQHHDLLITDDRFFDVSVLHMVYEVLSAKDQLIFLGDVMGLWKFTVGSFKEYFRLTEQSAEETCNDFHIMFREALESLMQGGEAAAFYVQRIVAGRMGEGEGIAVMAEDTHFSAQQRQIQVVLDPEVLHQEFQQLSMAEKMKRLQKYCQEHPEKFTAPCKVSRGAVFRLERSLFHGHRLKYRELKRLIYYTFMLEIRSVTSAQLAVARPHQAFLIPAAKRTLDESFWRFITRSRRD